MRSPADMDIIVLDVNNRCFLNCSNCTRLIAHQTKTRELTPDQLRAALRSLVGWWKPGRVVGMIGGEPTLHSQFSELCKVMREEWNPGLDTTHGRKPIDDFNAFAEQRLFDRANGRGLWTSFGPRFMDHYETVMDTFSHWNPNDHSAGGRHQTGLVDAQEMCEALGIPWEDWPKYRDNCWVQNTWSASVTPAGAYFCEYAGQLDLLYNEGKRAWPIESDWWRRKPSEFGEQLEICEMCSLCLPGPSQVDELERDIVGEKHRLRLEMAGSPAVKKGRFEQFDAEQHIERRTIDRKDNYTNGPRVSADNQHVRPAKVTAIVTCVWRAHHLKETLEHNAKQVDELIVVTSHEDEETMNIVDSTPEHVKGIKSDAWREDDHAFNKGRMINRGLCHFSMKQDWILLLDADVMLPDGFKDWFHSHSLNPGVIYGATREGDGSGDKISGINEQPNGYFQLFNRRASAIAGRWPNVMSEKFCSAGGVDSWLLQQFEPAKRIMTGLSVKHIPHGEVLGGLWNGYDPRPRWRQFGMIWQGNFIPVGHKPQFVNRVLLTDTATEEQWEMQIDNGVLTVDRPHVGHLHVAYWG